MNDQSATGRTVRIMRYAARIIALLWAGWWVFFGVASGIGKGLNVPGVLIHLSVPGLIFLITAIAAWRWEGIGGAALVLEGLLVLIGYPLVFRGMSLNVIVMVLLTMALPPLVAGGLFIAGWWKSRSPNSPTAA